MSITDRQRLKLLRTLETVIGPEDASTLMDHLPPVTWANVATVDHVSAIGDQTTKSAAKRDAGVIHPTPKRDERTPR